MSGVNVSDGLGTGLRTTDLGNGGGVPETELIARSTATCVVGGSINDGVDRGADMLKLGVGGTTLKDGGGVVSGRIDGMLGAENV